MIINQIGKLEKHLDDKSLRLLIRSTAVRYKLKMVLLYIMYFLSQILVFVEVWLLDSENTLSSVFIMLFRATYPMQVLHFVLYCDIVTMFFRALNEDIRQSPIFVHHVSKIEFFKYAKLVHLDLWKLVVEINNFFGLILLFSTMFWFIDITHQLYWIFLNAYSKLNWLGIIGGYKIFERVFFLYFKWNHCRGASIISFCHGIFIDISQHMRIVFVRGITDN